MKTTELTGAALDWAVMHALYPNNKLAFFQMRYGLGDFRYSVSWDQSGPIIEREEIGLGSSDGSVWPLNTWIAAHPEDGAYFFGPTPLIAAMRCFVASKLGDEVDIPKELMT